MSWENAALTRFPIPFGIMTSLNISKIPQVHLFWEARCVTIWYILSILESPKSLHIKGFMTISEKFNHFPCIFFLALCWKGDLNIKIYVSFKVNAVNFFSEVLFGRHLAKIMSYFLFSDKAKREKKWRGPENIITESTLTYRFREPFVYLCGNREVSMSFDVKQTLSSGSESSYQCINFEPVCNYYKLQLHLW